MLNLQSFVHILVWNNCESWLLCWNFYHWILLILYFRNIYDSYLSHPSILGVTLCFCTGSYAAAGAAAAGGSAKNGPIATKRKANILIELQASNVTNGMDLPDSDWGNFSCRRAVDSSSFIWAFCISDAKFVKTCFGSTICMNCCAVILMCYILSSG